MSIGRYSPGAYNRSGVSRRSRGRKKIIALALVLVLFCGVTIAKADFNSWFTQRINSKTSQVLNIDAATKCIGPSWGSSPEQMLNALAGQVMDQFIDTVLGQFQQMAMDWITDLIGSQIMNLSQTASQISDKFLKGLQQVTKIDLQIKAKPGGLQMGYCFPEYGDVHAAFGEAIRGGMAGPLAGANGNPYYLDMVRRKSIYYPDSSTSIYSSDPSAYVSQVGKTTIAMGGAGTDLNSLIAKGNLSKEDAERLTGVGQRLSALSSVNTALATDGADAVTYSADVWRRMSQFNPDSWDNGFPEQAMKDIPKLLYLQNQMISKLLRLQGEHAIQQAAIGQTKTDELSQKAIMDYMRSGRVQTER